MEPPELSVNAHTYRSDCFVRINVYLDLLGVCCILCYEIWRADCIRTIREYELHTRECFIVLPIQDLAKFKLTHTYLLILVRKHLIPLQAIVTEAYAAL